MGRKAGLTIELCVKCKYAFFCSVFSSSLRVYGAGVLRYPLRLAATSAEVVPVQARTVPGVPTLELRASRPARGTFEDRWMKYCVVSRYTEQYLAGICGCPVLGTHNRD